MHLLSILRLISCCCAMGGFAGMFASASFGAAVEAQPLRAQARPVSQALELLGSPLSAAQQNVIDDPEASVQKIQEALDPLSIATVRLGTKESSVHAGLATVK